MADRKINWRGAWQAGGTFLKSLVVPGVAGAPAAPVNNEIWVDTAAGRIKAHINGGTVQIPISTDIGSGLTTEDVQDVVGAMLGVDTGDLDFTYDDAGNAISVVLKPDIVTYSKIQNVTTARLLGRATAGTGDVEELTLGADLEFSAGALRMKAFTGDITKAAGTVATTIGANKVTLGMMATLAANSVIGNNTGAAATPIALTMTQLRALLALTEADITVGATSRVLGRITAGAGPAEELTAANLLTILGPIDAATLNTLTAAQIQTNVINAITNGASAAYDTLIEIQQLMEADDTQTTGMLNDIALRARFKDLAIPAGATPQIVNHAFNLGNIGSWDARCYVAASGITEEYEITPTDANNFSISDESGAAIPAGRRIFITAGV